MHDIANPFIGGDGYRCFGCCPDNPIGLAMTFRDEGDQVVSEWKPKPDYCGFNGVLHGGVQAALHDEIASWYVFAKLGTAGFTADLSIRYLSPVYIAHGHITLKAALANNDGRRAVMTVSLYDGHGTLCSQSDVAYAIVPAHIAERKFLYPGKDAFKPTN
ncbi:MAG: PaaI family thioesterase [Spirochaetales bacterium]|nr:PaaI family thioesterase [Spirochaetales bacterium]MBP7263058.1 PaaI family thioesterase [Spirochaetia bacterium]